jgi:hypothetical protein
VVNIEDPIGDANFLNDQGNNATIGHQGEHTTPADAGSVSDFSKIWFTSDAENVSVHILTEKPGPAINALRFDVYASPGKGSVAESTVGCIRFAAIVGGDEQGHDTTWQGDDVARILDACNDGTSIFSNGVEATLTMETLADGTGLFTITGPKSYSPLLADGQVLTKPTAVARVTAGADGVAAAYPVYTDNTVVGTDFTITSPAIAEPDQGQTDPPGKGKKKGCPKGKGKKKGACPQYESTASSYGGGMTFYL